VSIRVHDDWASPGFDRRPAAELVGPFPLRQYLSAWWRWQGGGEPLIVESDSALVALFRGPGGVEFVGEPELTDYHAPLGDGLEDLVEELVAWLPEGTRFRFDSMPLEVSTPMAAGFRRAGVPVGPVQHEVAAIVDLPSTHDQYLAALGAKDRHELRRKRRRFDAAHGPASLVRDDGSGLSRFTAMHRGSRGQKGRFMDERLEAFFSALLGLQGTVLDFLVDGDGRELAAGFGFEDAAAYYLYNSAYCPAAAEASPGVVLVDLLIGQAIEAGRSRFDLLKGDEAYKFRLGARPRPLYVVEGVK
jgi:CelD/BcsL family acetyltransferase involved in cellulose biosynthesis